MPFLVETLNGSFFVRVKMDTNARACNDQKRDCRQYYRWSEIIRNNKHSRRIVWFRTIHRISEVIKEGEKIRIIFFQGCAQRQKRDSGEEFGIGLTRAMGRSISFPPVSSLSFFVPAGTSARYLHYKYTFTEVFLVSLNSLFPRRRTSSSAGPSTVMNVLSDSFPSCIARKGCFKNFNSAGKVCHHRM